MKVFPFIKILRIKHWIKNFLIFIPFFFSFNFHAQNLPQLIYAFITFCLIASVIYIFNDINDIEKDKFHPEKKNRPLPSGQISIRSAVVLLILVFLLSALLASFLNYNTIVLISLYFIMNIAYSLWLKSIPIVDVMVIAIGFVIRIIVGAFVLNIPTSHWLLLTAFFVSLFLAFGKRKSEMQITKQESNEHRKSIVDYTDGFINQCLAISGGISIVFYSLYTIDKETVLRFGSDYLIYTTPIIVFGMLHFYHLFYNKNKGSDLVEIMINDKVIQFIILIWVILVLAIYYRVF